jgi:hypothetical protein
VKRPHILGSSLGPRCGLAGREHAATSALAAAEPLDERSDRRARRDYQARQRLAGQQPDVPAAQALDGHAWFGTHAKNPYKQNTAGADAAG